MKIRLTIVIGILLAGLETDFAQSRSFVQAPYVLHTQPFFNTGGPSKKMAGITEQPEKLVPLLVKKKAPLNNDLFSQLMNWDCRIKVKLNDQFNFVLTYN